MATYAIGDVQGCCDELDDLLDQIRFDSAVDTLWFVGDLVNRGPDSLGVLRRVRALGERAVTVLGNHDIHLLAAAHGVRELRRRDTLAQVLKAPDRDELLEWLRSRPLLHYDQALGAALVHAGIPPGWDIETAQHEAASVETTLRTGNLAVELRKLYGDKPAVWSKQLRGRDRQRFTLNALTRMRFVSESGELDFEHSGPPGSQPSRLRPWYQRHAGGPVRTRVRQQDERDGVRVVFGHWAALRVSETPDPRYKVLATDTGCVWGGLLSTVRLDDETWFNVPSRITRGNRAV